MFPPSKIAFLKELFKKSFPFCIKPEKRIKIFTFFSYSDLECILFFSKLLFFEGQNDMKIKLIFIGFLLLTLINVEKSFCFGRPLWQYAFGTTGGVTHSKNYAEYSWSCNFCFTLRDGKTDKPFGGLTFEFPVTKSIFESSIIIRSFYQDLSFIKSCPGDKYPSLHEDPNTHEFQTVTSETGFDYIISYKTLTNEFLYNINVGIIPVSFFVGPSFSYVTYSNFKEKYYIVTPSDVCFKRVQSVYESGGRYEDKDRTIIAFDGEIPYVNKLRVGLVVGARYALDLGLFRIAPYFSYDFGMTQVVSQGNPKCPLKVCAGGLIWKMDFMHAGIDLLYLF